MGDCVHVYGVLFVGVSSRGAVCFCSRPSLPLPPPLDGKKNKKNDKKYTNFVFASCFDLVLINLCGK